MYLGMPRRLDPQEELDVSAWINADRCVDPKSHQCGERKSYQLVNQRAITLWLTTEGCTVPPQEFLADPSRTTWQIPPTPLGKCSASGQDACQLAKLLGKSPRCLATWPEACTTGQNESWWSETALGVFCVVRISWTPRATKKMKNRVGKLWGAG